MCKLNWAFFFLNYRARLLPISLMLCICALFSVTVELRSSVAAWISVLELDSLGLNRETESLSPHYPPSPPVLIRIKNRSQPKTSGQV